MTSDKAKYNKMSAQRVDKREVSETQATQLQIRIRENLKDELKITANEKGLTVSALIHSLIVKAVRDAKHENPLAFGLHDPQIEIADNELKEILFEGFRDDPIDMEMLHRAIQMVKMAREMEGKPFSPPVSGFKRKERKK